MKFCPHCKTDYLDFATICKDCNVRLISHASSIVDEVLFQKFINFYHNDFPSIFFPYDGFYENWIKIPTGVFRGTGIHGVHSMLHDIKKWLKIDNIPINCTYSTLRKPGVYIFHNGHHHIQINDLFRNDPFKTAAILAHEIMHCYMRIFNLEDPDTYVNEVKTDISTICTGLGILVINGMQFKRGIISNEKNIAKALFSGINKLTDEEQTSFGYFKPKDYCQYFNKYLQINGCDIIGYILPQSRYFLPKKLKKSKAQKKLKIILKEEKIWKRNKYIHTIVYILFLILIIYVLYNNLLLR